jgi:uncharacterized protein
MKKLFFVVLFLSALSSYAQESTKVILQLQTADTLVHKSTVLQINNIKKEFPDAEVELVCHGPGLDFLLKDKSRYANRLDKLKLKDVSVVGCEFTMGQRNVKKEDLVSFAKTVPFAIAEIIRKQQDGWLYVKLGF